MSGLSTALAAFLLLCSVAIEAQTLPAAGRTAPSPAPQNLVEIDASQPVTALEGWQIERMYCALCSVLVEVDEAITAAGV